MFGRRRRYPRGGMGGGGGLGLFLLAMQAMSMFNFFSRTNEFYPVTLVVLAVNVLAFLRPGGVAWPSLRQACISVQGVWYQGQWKRMLYAPFLHANDFHLYYNMASFIWKAISLERAFGSAYFLYMVSVFSLLTNLVYLAINFALAEMLDQWSYVQSCAVGFSGVLFALKVVTTHLQPRGVSLIMGVFPVPMRLACWVELVLISVLFPNVSFVGHLAGILVGLAWVYGPLKVAMDIPLSVFSDFAPSTANQSGQSYTYRASSTGYRPPAAASSRAQQGRGRQTTPSQPRQTYTSYTYASGATGYSRHDDNQTGGVSEEAELQEAIQRSLEHDRSADSADNNVQTAVEGEGNQGCRGVGERESPPGAVGHHDLPDSPAESSVRQRHTGGRDTEEQQHTSAAERVRAARLKRFTDGQQT